jgi:hypothetical protein
MSQHSDVQIGSSHKAILVSGSQNSVKILGPLFVAAIVVVVVLVLVADSYLTFDQRLTLFVHSSVYP